MEKVLSPRSSAYALANIDPHHVFFSYLPMTAQKKELEYKSFSPGQYPMQLQYCTISCKSDFVQSLAQL